MRWPWQRRIEERDSALLSISDPALAEWFGLGTNYSGIQVGEGSALGVSAFWRAASLISGTIAGLPMPTLIPTEDGVRPVSSMLDNPGGPAGMTPYEWRETVLLHLLIHGNAFLAHVHNQAGGLAGLTPIHPLAVSIELRPDAPGGRIYRANLIDGSYREFTPETMTHVPGPSLDGIRGLSLVGIARTSLGTTIAGDRAAARTFSSGAMISGVVSPEDDVTDFDAVAIKASLDAKVAGWENAGDIAVINRKLKFTPWTQTMVDAQFLESRQFQIEEVARWTGVPPHLLMQTEKQTSWGTGVAEQNRGLARFTLAPWTARLEQRLSTLLPSARFVQFDYAGLERPTPEAEIELLIKQVDAGLITPNEARHVRNLPPIPGGDVLRVVGGAAAPPEGPAPANDSEAAVAA